MSILCNRDLRGMCQFKVKYQLCFTVFQPVNFTKFYENCNKLVYIANQKLLQNAPGFTKTFIDIKKFDTHFRGEDQNYRGNLHQWSWGTDIPAFAILQSGQKFNNITGKLVNEESMRIALKCTKNESK